MRPLHRQPFISIVPGLTDELAHQAFNGAGHEDILEQRQIGREAG